MADKPSIYLIPVPIDEEAPDTIPASTLVVLHRIRHFVAEKGKTARRVIKALNHPLPQNEIEVLELPKHGPVNFHDISDLLKSGNDIGILSESGCPGIADPGSEIVAFAHRNGYSVIPLVGPSSIILALMASGFSGQSFVFHGYLPYQKEELTKKLKLLESTAARLHQSQIFIETPYRNLKLAETLANTLHKDTMLSVQSGLTGPNALSCTLSIGQWQKRGFGCLSANIPSVFIIG